MRNAIPTERLLIVLCVILSCGQARVPALAQEAATAELQPAREELRRWLEEVQHPAPWMTWGGDLRLRQTYHDNAKDLLDEVEDAQHYLRLRARLYTEIGPFFSDELPAQPGGLRLYARLTHEFRTYVQRQETTEAANIDEVVLDNLYADWQRIAGLPISFRAGRQDLHYGQGFVIRDGTPTDGARTYYSDALKVTAHLEQWDARLDVFAADNKARQSRPHPLNDQDRLVSEYDTSLLGAYLVSDHFEQHELNAYYIYKDDDPAGGRKLPGRAVHTVGALVLGRRVGNWDYYGELAYQWGREGPVRRRGWGLSMDAGYALSRRAWEPRIHAGYEYLSGDDPATRTYEGWDPVLGRWRRWSHLHSKRWANESGLTSGWSNLQRFTVGVGAQPMKKLNVVFDCSCLLANEHTYGKAFVSDKAPYSSGHCRGQLLKADFVYNISRNLVGEVALEYFCPGSYYDDEADDAVFLRWQLGLKF